MRSLRAFTCALLCLAALPVGCRTYGEIRIGAPKVFSKARVIRDRDREVRWLEEQLEEAGKAEPSFQAYRDVRVFESFYNRFTGRWDAANAEALGLAQRANRYQQRIEVAERQVELKRLQRQLDYVNTAPINSVTSTDPPPAPTSEDPAKPAPEKDEAALAQLAEQKKASDALKARVEALEEESKKVEGPELPDPTQLQETKAAFSFLDRFSDKKSNREAVTAAIREKLFDDSHDLVGHTLYELRFDMTLVPGASSDRYADVQLQITPQSALTQPEWRSLHNRWLAAVQREIRRDQLRLAHLFMTGDPGKPLFLPQLQTYLDRTRREVMRQTSQVEALNQQLDAHRKDWQRVTRLWRIAGRALKGFQAPKDAEKAKKERRVLQQNLEHATTGREEARVAFLATSREIGRVRARVQRSEAAIRLLEQAKSGQPLSEADQEGLLVILSTIVRDYYFAWLGKLLPNQRSWTTRWLPNPRGVSLPVSVIDITKPLRISDARASFQDAVTCLPNTAQVLSVQPQERIQNVSEVAAKETLMTLVFALEAVLPKGVTVDNFTKFQRRSQTLLNSIRRQPLVVPYVASTDTFGWLLGPEFRIEDDEAEFLHRPVHHAYTASVRVPAWWTVLKLQREGSWINGKGHRTRKLVLGTTQTNVPGDLSSLTTALFVRAGATQAPRLSDFVDQNGTPCPVHVTVGKPAKILIRGRELWRQPEVYLGHQRADQVEVATDLQGVYAVFSSVVPPITSGKHTGPLPVTVTVKTTTGEDRLSRQAFVHPATPTPKTPKVERALRLTTRYVVGNGQSLALGLDKTKLPSAYASLSATAKQVNAAGAPTVLSVPTPLPTAPTLTFTIANTLPTAPTIYRLSVRLKLTPGSSDTHELLADRGHDFVFFPTAASRQATTSTVSITVPKNGTAPSVGLLAKLSVYDAFLIAFPALTGADPGVTIQLEVNGVRSPMLATTLTKVGTAGHLVVAKSELKAAFEAEAGLLPAAGAEHVVQVEIHLRDGTVLPAGTVKVKMGS